MRERTGLIHVYTGDGKGKTTAAIGQVVRAAGWGLSCRVIKFMKERSESGEDKILSTLPGVSLTKVGLNLLGPAHVDLSGVRRSLLSAVEASKKAVSGEYELVVLDEIITAVAVGAVLEKELVDIIDAKSADCELILTGRGAVSSIIDKADLVTEMREIKHPYATGQPARRGIEF